MTTTGRTCVTHPLDAVTADEISDVRRITADAGLVASTTRFVYVGLQEPDTDEVLRHRAGQTVTRRFRVLLLDLESQVSRDVVVDVTAGPVVSDVELDTATSGQLPVLDEEFELVEQLLAADERWLAALDVRGLDVAQVRVAPLSAGRTRSTRTRRAGGCCAAWRSCSRLPRTPPGPTRSTVWWPTSTRSTGWSTRSSTPAPCRCPPARATTTTPR